MRDWEKRILNVCIEYIDRFMEKKDTNHKWKQSNNWIQKVHLGIKLNCFLEIRLFIKIWLSIIKEINFD